LSESSSGITEYCGSVHFFTDKGRFKKNSHAGMAQLISLLQNNCASPLTSAQAKACGYIFIKKCVAAAFRLRFARPSCTSEGAYFRKNRCFLALSRRTKSR
jgi:hypothetical protein